MTNTFEFRSFKAFNRHISLIFFTIVVSSICLSGQLEKSREVFQDPEALVKHLYEQVTFPAGQSPDWNHIRKLFIPEATVVMRMGKNKTATLSLDGWILDFVNFIYDADVKSTGFEEKVLKIESLVFGDIAHIIVLYTSYIPGRSREPREGVDSFHLIRKEGTWRIVSILNEIPGPDRPKPDILK